MPTGTDGAGPGQEVAPDVFCLPVLIANVCLIGPAGADAGGWVLVDAGLPNSEGRIRQSAAERFGPRRPPAGIILTHGHFDHVGAVKALAEEWDVPVFAHPQEMPYLSGRADYPPPDPTVGGLMSLISPLYPRDGIDLGNRVQPLPEDGSVPGLPDWRWLHTSGHTPGHISLFRERDRVLVAGDAFTTVQQESAVAVLLQEQEVHGPPAYFTTDWGSAEASVKRLAALKPSVVVSGHGRPMGGEELTKQLEELAQHFRLEAVPEEGRYVEKPVRGSQGPVGEAADQAPAGWPP